jgi:hypothetical protein
MRRSNLLIAFYLVLIFGSGIVVGAFASRLYWPATVQSKQGPPRPSPEEWRRRYVKELQSRLNLSTDQLDQLNQILDDTGAKVHAERERHGQGMKSIREEQVTKISSMLDDKQRVEYEKLRKEHELARAAQQRNK